MALGGGRLILKKFVGRERLTLKIGGSREVGLVGGGLLKLVGGWPQKQVGDERMPHHLMIAYIHHTSIVLPLSSTS